MLLLVSIIDDRNYAYMMNSPGRTVVFLQGEMLATSEQDFLNAHFKEHYFLIPIDYIMKHRRMVKERKLWVSTIDTCS